VELPSLAPLSPSSVDYGPYSSPARPVDTVVPPFGRGLNGIAGGGGQVRPEDGRGGLAAELECELLADVLGEVRFLTGRMRRDADTQRVCSPHHRPTVTLPAAWHQCQTTIFPAARQTHGYLPSRTASTSNCSHREVNHMHSCPHSASAATGSSRRWSSTVAATVAAMKITFRR